MLRFHNYFKQSPQNKLSLKNNTQLAYAGQWKKVYSNTEIDRWYVGDYSSANYTITAEFSSNKKEVLQVLVVARPDQATVTVYGRTSIDDSLINISAVVTNSYLSLIANVTDTAFVGTKIIFFANYAECIQPLSLAESLSFVDSSSGGGYDGGGAGGAATSFSQLSGTIGISQIPNGLITPAKLNLNNSLIPSADVIHDLGSAAYRWRDLYLSGSSIQLGAAAITASGSSVILPAGSTIAGSAINSFSTIQVSGQSNIVADSVSDSLTIVAGSGIQITTDAGSDAITITNTGAAANSFSTIQVSGQSNVVADTNSDSLTIVAGSGIQITTDAGSDAITIQSTVTATNSFSTIQVSGQSNVVADTNSDSLTIVAGPGIEITTNAGSDSITITNTGGGGGGASGVSSGTTGRLAYYAATGSVVQDTGAGLTWNGSTLSITGTISASGAVSYVRAYFDTLVELQAVSAATWHGMVAHVHATGRIYFAHAGAWAPVANLSDLNYFSTIAVAGQASVVADSATDTLTLVAGTNVTITTDATTDAITINAAGGGASTLDDLSDVVISAPTTNQVLKYDGTNWVNGTDATGGGGVASDSFATIAVAGQSNVVADSSSDTLTLVAGSGITITTNAGTDTITIAGSGASTFSGLSDATSAALTVDEIYLQAITRLVVTPNGSSSYRFDQYGASDNPTIYAISGTTIAFDISAVTGSHPFLIQTSGGVNYDTGLIHVSTAGVVSTGSSAQGKTSGILYWKIPQDTTGNYRYQCSVHGGMVGVITITPGNNIGYLNIPQNSQSASYTLTLADSGKHIFHPADDANARTYTIPANSSVAYPVGAALAFINMTSQLVTIAINTDTMYLSGTGTTGPRTLAQYGSASAIKITSTSWLISGSGLT
jgi:plastocyanin